MPVTPTLETLLKPRVLTVLVAAVALAACSRTPPASALVGRWTPASAELGGQPFPVANFGGASLVLTAGTYEFAGDTGTYSVLAANTPAQMDIHGRAGPNAGRTILAIYGLTGDQLTVCYQLGAGERPNDFTSPPGTQVLLVHYQRAP